MALRDSEARMREEELSEFRDSVRSAANSARRDSQMRSVCCFAADESELTDGSDGTNGSDERDWIVLLGRSAGVAISAAG